jgi:AMP-binding enzyme
MSAGDLSYAGLGGLVRRFSSMLRSLGIYKGAHVFTVMGRGPELYVAMLGALRNGSVVSPPVLGIRLAPDLGRRRRLRRKERVQPGHLSCEAEAGRLRWRAGEGRLASNGLGDRAKRPW